ncbi:serine/threonine protein kinase [Chondromyces crocatus]|uniref:Protein kinase domain-containing protein n=1 Tax=Chondromyces crocatus TaxID=52 RepID=A0A0K1ENA8_CHOCO|nr:serine/threonine-protein kinase [Chondromyces crocatus]AKT42344.1 uncharacterized protein CMC5_065700 [Chondromyces crocatus]
MPQVKLLDPSDARRRLDRYELIGEIASGGMASVFLARLAGVGGFQRFIAIKRLHPHLANEREFIDMFLDEARLAAGIHSPHVVPILEIGTTDAGYYLVMEYIEGDTLARVLARSASRGNALSPSVVVRIMLDALVGLHAAHELLGPDGRPVSLVHRDCSPQNILIGVDGCTRLTDFGVARATSRLSSTRPDRMKGKLAYMSPEQAGGDALDRRSDLFAMGTVLWESLAGRRLFKGDSEGATLTRIMTEPIPRLRDANPEAAAALDEVCARALERYPEPRFQTAAEMAEALERAASESLPEGVASPRQVAAVMQELLGQEIAAQRESVRVWLQHESSGADLQLRSWGESSEGGRSIGTLSAGSSSVSKIIPVALPDEPPSGAREPSITPGSMAMTRQTSAVPMVAARRKGGRGWLAGIAVTVLALGGSGALWAGLGSSSTPTAVTETGASTPGHAVPPADAAEAVVPAVLRPPSEKGSAALLGEPVGAPSAEALTPQSIDRPAEAVRGAPSAPPIKAASPAPAPVRSNPVVPAKKAATEAPPPPSDMANPYR